MPVRVAESRFLGLRQDYYPLCAEVAVLHNMVRKRDVVLTSRCKDDGEPPAYVTSVLAKAPGVLHAVTKQAYQVLGILADADRAECLAAELEEEYLEDVEEVRTVSGEDYGIFNRW